MQKTRHSIGPRHSIGKEAAIKLAETKWWIGKTSREICDVQLFTKELCMDFGDFHRAIETSLGRPVYTHEFGLNYDGIVKQYLGEQSAPTLEQIIDLIPVDKRMIITQAACKAACGIKL